MILGIRDKLPSLLNVKKKGVTLRVKISLEALLGFRS